MGIRSAGDVIGKKFPLRNNHTVFIFGAGFSRLRGLPLISDFALRMRDAAIWCEQADRVEEYESIYKVLEYRLEAASAAYRIAIDLENIEELFSLASAGNPSIAAHVRVAIAATLNYCESTLPHPQVRYDFEQNRDLQKIAPSNPNGTNANIYPVMLQRLIGSKAPDQCSFITFNYDLVLENALRQLGHDWDYRIIGSAEDNKYPVLKMHGSVNWARDGKKDVRVHANYEELRAARAKLEIVPPTWNKVLSPSLVEVWRNANEVLTTATNIVVIGFSMPPTDLHFKYLLASGMKGNISLRKIVFVDPNPEVPARSTAVFSPREISSQRVQFQSIRVEELFFNGPHLPAGFYTLKAEPGVL